MDYYPAFAQLLNQYLQAQERTPTWLAKRLHLNSSTVNRWLNHDARPGDPETIVRIADLLCVHSNAERQALLIAAGYGYQEPLPASHSETSQPLTAGHLPQAVDPASHSLAQVDWGEAPDVSQIYGRSTELSQLTQWLVDERCRLVAVLGMGGLGKTVLATRAATQVEKAFTAVIWRSLRNAPPVEELLGQCIQVASNYRIQEFPAGVNQRIALLMEYLQRQRCLLVLDNFETVLHREHTGHYLPGYEGYGQLLQRMGEGQHQSCLMLTSREKPKELTILDGDRSAVHTLSLIGLQPVDGCRLLQEKGLSGGEDDWVRLHERYSGNPLALKIAAETIQALFAGNITAFLQEEVIVFGDISDLLTQQFARLSSLEQELLFWLAIEREPVALDKLRANLMQPPAKAVVLEALRSLRQRSLVEGMLTGFTLQNVVLEYLTTTLIDQVCDEITSGQVVLLRRHALLKAQAKSYVRESQRTLLLAPIAQWLVEKQGRQGIHKRLSTLLENLRQTQPHYPGYAGGNLLNLWVQLNGHLAGQDFSHLAVWQAYLRGVNAQAVNFSQADLAGSVFTETFAAILGVTFSPDGKQLAAGTTRNEICIWRVDDGELLVTCLSHTERVRSVCFSPDGRLLASGSYDHTVRLWEPHSGRCLTTMYGHTDVVTSVCFSPDGTLLASGSFDQTVRLWEVHSGRCVTTLHGYVDGLMSVCFSPDGSLLAGAGEDPTIWLWEVHSGRCLATLHGHTSRVSSVCFSPGRNLLASGSFDQTVRLWEVTTSRCITTLHGHTKMIWSVCFSPDGKLLASAGDDHTIRIWEVTTGRCIAALHGHTNLIWSVRFSPDGKLLASGSWDQSVRLWEVSTGQCVNILQGYTDEVLSVCFSVDGQWLASSNWDQTLRLWEMHSGRCLVTLQGHTKMVWSICFSRDSSLLASSSLDQTVRVWEVPTGRCITTLQGHVEIIFSVCFSPDGSLLASGSGDHTVRLWELCTGQCLATLTGHTNALSSVCFSPSSNLLASGSEDCTVRLWEVSSGRCITILQGHTDTVTCLSFSPSGTLLASASWDHTVRLWEVSSGRCITILQGHTSKVASVCFSADGNLLTSAGDDQTLRLWEVSTGQCLTMLPIHTGEEKPICFSPDGNLLASSSTDGIIKLSDVQTGECVQRLRSDRPYAQMNITGATGLTNAQKGALKALGAVED